MKSIAQKCLLTFALGLLSSANVHASYIQELRVDVRDHEFTNLQRWLFFEDDDFYSFKKSYYELIYGGSTVNLQPNGKYVYLTYTTTESTSGAITDVILSKTYSFSAPITVNGIQYYLAPCYKDAPTGYWQKIGDDDDWDDYRDLDADPSTYAVDYNLNYGTSADPIYLYYTTDPAAGSAITAVGVSKNSPSDGLYQVGLEGHDAYNLNVNTTGSKIYLGFERGASYLSVVNSEGTSDGDYVILTKDWEVENEVIKVKPEQDYSFTIKANNEDDCVPLAEFSYGMKSSSINYETKVATYTFTAQAGNGNIVTITKRSHNFDGDMCTVCHKAVPTDVTIGDYIYHVNKVTSTWYEAQITGLSAGVVPATLPAIPNKIVAYGKEMNVTTISANVFANCTALQNVTLGANITTVEANAFSGCTSLSSLTLNQYLASVGASAFEGCTSLTTLTIPTRITTWGANAFKGCNGLSELTLTEGMTTIGESAFEGCTSLDVLMMPASLTTIGAAAFKDCTGLDSVVFTSNAAPTLGANAFGGKSGECEVHVHAKSKSAFATTGWESAFAGQVWLYDTYNMSKTYGTYCFINDVVLPANIAAFDSVHANGIDIYGTPIEAVEGVVTIPANTPVVLYKNPEYSDPIQIAVRGNATGYASTCTSGQLVGMIDMAANAKIPTGQTYVLQGDNGSQTFNKVSSISANNFRCYLNTALEYQAAAGSRSINIFSDDDLENLFTTDIAPAMAEVNNDSATYNLQGQRVGNGYRGLIIRNGRRILQK